MPTISDAEIGEWLERVSKWRGETGMIADAIRLVERLIAEDRGLRVENRKLRKRLEVLNAP